MIDKSCLDLGSSLHQCSSNFDTVTMTLPQRAQFPPTNKHTFYLYKTTTMSLAMDSEYKRALGTSIGILVGKNMINHVLTVRARLSTLKMNQETTPESEAKKWDLPIFGILQLALGSTVGPFRDENSLERFVCMSKNATENEPYFMAMAIVWPLLGPTPEIAPKLLQGYVACRLAHYAIFMFVRRQPWRALAWTASAMVNLTIAYQVYQTVA